MKDKLQAFFTWWLRGLGTALPDSLRHRIVLPANSLQIMTTDSGFSFKYYSGKSGSLLESRTFKQEDTLEKSSTLEWARKISQNNSKTTLLFPEDRLLKKTINLPLASEVNLHSIMKFEMDRQTPFSADQVYFDCLVKVRDQKNDKLEFDLYVTPKKNIDPVIKEIQSWQIVPDTISVIKNESTVAGLNLLPKELRPNGQGNLDKQTLGLVFATILLGIIALYGPLLLKQNKLEEIRTQVAEYRKQAMTVQPLIKERDGIRARTRFLDEKRLENAKTIDIINELTTILPDNTWLTRLIIREQEIQLHGESEAAIAIIELMENSKRFKDAQFKSPVTKNNVTKKDKFHVSASLEEAETS